MPKTKLNPTPPAVAKKKAVAKPKDIANSILDDILDGFPAEAKAGPVPASSVPAGFRVTAVYFDAEGKRYKSMGDWLVKTRSGDLIVGHRFHTEAEARSFAATAEVTA